MAFDTTDEAAAVQREVWLRLGQSGRARVTVELSETARRLSLSGVRTRHPELDEHAVMREFIRTVHGVDIGRG